MHILLKQKRSVTLRRQRTFCCFFFVADVSSCFCRPSVVFTGTSRAESLPFRDALPRVFVGSWYSSIPPPNLRQRICKMFNKSCGMLPSKLETFADSSRKIDFRSELSERRHSPFTAFLATVYRGYRGQPNLGKNSDLRTFQHQTSALKRFVKTNLSLLVKRSRTTAPVSVLPESLSKQNACASCCKH